jgi:general secretion pathway protein D
MMTLRKLIASAPLLLVAVLPFAAAAQDEGDVPAAKPAPAPLPAPTAGKKPLSPPRVGKAPVPPVGGAPIAQAGKPLPPSPLVGRPVPAGAAKPAPAPVGGKPVPPPPAPGGDVPLNHGGAGKPGAAPAPGSAPAGEGVQRWQQTDDTAKKSDKPTLGADFVKNCTRLKPGVKVQLDIYDEELEAVVKLIACMTGKNIILAENLKGKKITIYSPTQVTADEAYKAFLTALEANGYTLSSRGKFLKIIPIKDYDGNPDPIRTGLEPPPAEDRMVTQIVPLKYVDATEVTEVLSKLATPNAQFIAYAPSNSLIITETGANLRKLLDLINQIDVAGGEEQVWIYQVLHAEAGDIASKIQEIFADQGKSGAHHPPGAAAAPRRSTGPAAGVGAKGASTSAASAAVGDSDVEVSLSKVVADERTNRLIIVATARSYQRIKRLIARLDVDIPGDGQIHILQLKHAKAADLANVLSNLSQNAQQRNRQGARGGRPQGAPRAGGAAPKAPGGEAAGGEGGSAVLFEGDVSITADEGTNTLVITSSLKDYLSLKNVVDVLDRPRRQVFIEAVVMEVSIRNDRKFGVALHGAIPGPTIGGESIPIVFKDQPGDTSSLSLASAATLQGLAAAAVSESTVTLPGISQAIPKFGAILHALASSNDSNILSTPHLLTTDNQEAEIVVGQNVPFVSGFVGGAANLSGLGGAAGATGLGGFFPTVSVQRQDVALTLKITPRINSENFVTMEVEQVIEEVDSIDPVVGPTTSKRSVKTTVVVKDQNTVVIGGLQRNQQLNNEQKIPILGEIPVIGYLFRDTTKTRERRNLLLLLTPHVIEGPEDFRDIFKRKLEEHREFVERFHKEGETFVVGIDYGKKNGVVEAIHKAVRASQDEENLLEKLKEQQQGPPLPQDTDGVPVDGAPGAATGGVPTGPAGGGGPKVDVVPAEPPPPAGGVPVDVEPAPPPLGGDDNGGQP